MESEWYGMCRVSVITSLKLFKGASSLAASLSSVCTTVEPDTKAKARTGAVTGLEVANDMHFLIKV